LLRLLQNSLAVEQGKTVIMSIHQPSSAMFRSFDQLIMLSEGHVVYFGKPVPSLEYLRRLDLACPDGYNAADHWMDLLVAGDSEESQQEQQQDEAENHHSKKDDDLEQQQQQQQQAGALATTPLLTQPPRFQLQQAWDSEAIAEQEDNAVTLQSSEHGSLKKSDHASGGPAEHQYQQDMSSVNKYNTSWWTQYKVLTHRAAKNSRSAIFTWLNFIKSVALGLISGLMWYQRTYTEANVQDIRSFLFYTITYWMFDAMFGALMAFPTERQVILKERASGSYHLSAYFMAKTSSDVPVRLLLPTIYMIASYWMTGIDNRFSTFCALTGCTLLSSMAGEALGLFVGGAVLNMEHAMTIMTVVTLSFMLLGGFYVENLPSFLAWAQYISPFTYVFDSSLQVLFTQPVPCDGSGRLEDLCQGSSDGSASAQDVLDLFQVHGSIGFNLGILALFAIVPRYLAYVALRMKKDGERS
jgi:ABC-type multidrug transport system permease subunit